MPTLMTVGNSEGERRCDAKCYDAIDSHCTCICGGVNHGVGLKAAQGNCQKIAETICEDRGIKIEPFQLGFANQAAGQRIRHASRPVKRE